MDVETLKKFYSKNYSIEVVMKLSHDPSKGIIGDKPSLHMEKSG